MKSIDTPRRRKAWLLVSIAILLAVQIGARCWLISHAETISRDGTFHLPIARHFPPDPVGSKKSTVAHPGYPVAVSAMHFLMVGNNDPAGLEQWERAGVNVALIGSIVAILGVCCFTRLIFHSWWIAFWAAMLFGLGKKFAGLGADVLTDSLMLAFEIWALVFAMIVWRKLRNNRWSAVAIAGLVGVMSAGAYLVRPEGLVVLPVAFVPWLVGKVKLRLNWRQTLLSITAAGCVALLCMAPYMMKVGGVTPKWKIKQFVDSTSGPGQPDVLSASGLAAVYSADVPAAIRVVGRFTEAQHPALAGLTFAYLLVCLIGRTGKGRALRAEIPAVSGAGWALIAATWFFILPPIIMRYWSTGAMSHRYLMLPAAMMAGFAPAGLLALLNMLSALIAKKRAPIISASLLATIVCTIIAVLLAIHTLQPLHENKAFAKEAGLWIRNNCASDKAVLADHAVTFHYSDRVGRACSEDMLLAYLRKQPEFTRSSFIRKILAEAPYSYVAYMGPADDPWASESARIIREEGFVCVKTFPEQRKGNAPPRVAMHVYRRVSEQK